MSCAGHVTVMKAPPRLQRLHVSRTSSGLLQLLNCSSCFRSSCVQTLQPRARRCTCTCTSTTLPIRRRMCAISIQRPRAPEHLGMLNNLASQRAKPGAGTHLPRHRKTWRKLATHAQHVAASPTHCCFQCGMLNYPKEGDEIVVSNITNRRDCRAYRVFRYYSCPHRPLPASLITRVKPVVPCHARPSLALRSRSARALPRVSSPARGPPTHVPTRSPGTISES